MRRRGWSAGCAGWWKGRATDGVAARPIPSASDRGIGRPGGGAVTGLIRACRDAGNYIGICGQEPSDYPDFAEWLVEIGLESISLNPDTVVETWLYLSRGGTGGSGQDHKDSE